MYNRAWREDKIESLPRATSEESLAKLTKQRHRTPRDILQTIQRCGLMGEAASVKEELGYIRSWHQAHGYRGGLVLRELNCYPHAYSFDSDCCYLNPSAVTASE